MMCSANSNIDSSAEFHEFVMANLSIFKLLFYILHYGLAIKANKCSLNKLWMYRMSPHNLTGYT